MSSEASAVGGSLFGAAGSLIQGQQQSNALDTAAQVQRENASEALQKGAFDAQRQQLIAGQKIGSAEAAFGASGTTSDSVSAMNVLASSHANAEMDRLNILHGADIRAINYKNQATMDELGAKQTLQGSYFNAVSSIFMGGTKAYSYGMGANSGYSATADTGYSGADMAGGAGDSAAASSEADLAFA